MTATVLVGRLESGGGGGQGGAAAAAAAARSGGRVLLLDGCRARGQPLPVTRRLLAALLGVCHWLPCFSSRGLLRPVII